MNKDDINHISHTIETGKLPRLYSSHLNGNDFRGMANRVFHNLSVIQECQCCQLCFSSVIKNQQERI